MELRPSQEGYLRGDVGDRVKILYIAPVFDIIEGWIYARCGTRDGWLPGTAVSQPLADDPTNLDHLEPRPIRPTPLPPPPMRTSAAKPQAAAGEQHPPPAPLRIPKKKPGPPPPAGEPQVVALPGA